MIADIIIVYAQNVGPQQFAVIYKALYEEGVLGNLSVQPINDNGTGCFNFMIYIALYIPPLQSNQVKRTPQEPINEFIIQKLNPLLVVDFRLISIFLHV